MDSTQEKNIDGTSGHQLQNESRLADFCVKMGDCYYAVTVQFPDSHRYVKLNEIKIVST